MKTILFSPKRWQLAYRLQAAGASLVFALFAALPIDKASDFGGWLMRLIGPFTGAHRVATDNLRRAFKSKKDVELREILTAMWDNLGRTLGEYPHLGELLHDTSRVEIVDPTDCVAQLVKDGIGGILLGMHSGNWELSPVPGSRQGLNQYHFYRAPNNPFVDRLLAKMRAGLQQEGYLRKGAQGARQAAFLLKGHAHIGMLADQKQDEGIPVPFFGRDVMTTTAPAAFARRFGLPIGAGRIVRLKGARFRIYVEPVPVVTTADREADIVATTIQINQLLENWIRQNPGQWFWVHRRWPKETPATP